MEWRRGCPVASAHSEKSPTPSLLRLPGPSFIALHPSNPPPLKPLPRIYPECVSFTRRRRRRRRRGHSVPLVREAFAPRIQEVQLESSDLQQKKQQGNIADALEGGPERSGRCKVGPATIAGPRGPQRKGGAAGIRAQAPQKRDNVEGNSKTGRQPKNAKEMGGASAQQTHYDAWRY